MLTLLVMLICIHEAFALNKARPFKPTDLIFVLDGSGSEGQGNFRKQLAFVSNFTIQFEIGHNTTRVALVTFATDVTNEFYLDRYSDNSSVLRAIEQAHYPNGETNTHLALDHVRLNSLSPYHGAERNVSKVVFVLTDGHSLKPDEARRASMELKKDQQVTVVAIGIGSGVDYNELRAIASDGNHTFQVTNFDALNSIKAELTKTTCDTCNDSSDVCFVLDSSGSEGSANFHQQLEFVKMVVNEFSIDVISNVRICVVTFSTTSQCEVQLNSYNNKTALLENILKIPYRDGETMTNLGIDESLAQLTGNYANAGARNNANKVMILLTDGRSTEQRMTLNSAHKSHRAGVDVFAIGIGSSVDPYELRSIATDVNHVFKVDKFHDLPSIHQDVVDQICANSLIPPTSLPSTTPKESLIQTTTLPTTTTKELTCLNGGTSLGTTCLCTSRFAGKRCQIDADCTFDEGTVCNWTNTHSGDTFDWIVYREATPTDDTGPENDHTLGTANGAYVFIESSAPRVKDEKAWLQSPKFNPTGHQGLCLQFWYSMNGLSIGQLNVYKGNGSAVELVWTLSGNQGTQ